MTGFSATRRDVLKGTGIGLLGLAGLSTAPLPAAGHESVEADATDLLGPVQIPANSERGFNYPYYLYVPESTQEERTPILVEPNNTGTVSDDFEKHRNIARKVVDGTLGWTRTYSEALGVPLLMPVFPRPSTDPVDGNHYVHALDETTMNLDGGDLARVDRQLVNMVEHAQELLDEMSYPVADDVMLNGFSASGNFVNRFTALHPNVVRSVTAGGINGTLLLPLERAKGHTLNYHIGVADVEAITGDPFDVATWRDVAQFVYLGGEDENDTIPYSDAWNDTQREIALDVYGEDMQDERMPYCEGVYDDAGADATFEIYDGVGHRQPLEVQQDIVAFHRENAALKQISFTTAPGGGDTTLDVEVALFDDSDRFDLRARSGERGDITDGTTSVETGASVQASVDLATPVEEGERVSVLVVPAGTTSPDQSVASVAQSVAETPSIRVITPPTAADNELTVEHAVSADYETGSPIHVYVVADSSGGKQMVGTFEPGHSGRVTYDLDPDELDTAVDPGTQLSVNIVDIDTGDQLATADLVVGEGSQETDGPSASVAFDTQPTAGRERLGIEYAVDDDYEPTASLTLQLRIGTEHTVLLDVLDPGAAATETYSLEKVPADPGDLIEVSVVDQEPVGLARTVVIRETNGTVELTYAEPRVDDESDATVEYRVDDSYQVEDVLTLRAYTEGLPGTVPGEALTLLSPGDSGTETVTVGEDVAAGGMMVAIIDDEPLALAGSSPAPAGESTAERTSETRTGDGTESGGDGAEAASATDGSGPGFGVGSALASAGGLGYLLKRRLDDGSPSDDVSR